MHIESLASFGDHIKTFFFFSSKFCIVFKYILFCCTKVNIFCTDRKINLYELFMHNTFLVQLLGVS